MPVRTLIYLVFTVFAALLILSTDFLTRDRAAQPATRDGPLARAGTSTALAPAPPPVRVEPGTLYRWRDASGRIHYTTDTPPDAESARAIPFVRTLPAPPPGPAAGEHAGADARTGPAPAPAPAPARDALWSNPLSVYTPEGMADLFDDAERTARELEARDRQLDAALEMLKRP